MRANRTQAERWAVGINMDERVRYTSQRKMWDNTHIGGPLTNRRIDHYIRAGWYGEARRGALELVERRTADRANSK